MTVVTIVKGNVVTPNEVLYGGFVMIVGENIVAVNDSGTPIPSASYLSSRYSDAQVTVVESDFVIPGFVDIHNHGLGGHEDVLGHWSNPEYSLRELARCGTLTTLSSLIFSEDHKELVQSCIAAIGNCVNRYMTDCCVLGGVHAEGPVIHDRGGLPQANNRINLSDFKALCRRIPALKIMTISPHIDAASQYEKIRYLLETGVRPSLGHDRVATKQEILGALRLAPSEAEKLHVTHLCNVMTFHHRRVSLVNLSLCDRYPKASVYAGALPPTVEIIADLVHADAVVVQSTLLARKPTDIAVITDCISEHRPGKHVHYNGREGVVRAEGGCYLCDSCGSPSATLAGGTSSLSEHFHNLVSLFRVGIVEACQMAATTPARIARLNDVGSIEVGKKANLLLLNHELNTIERRMIYGNWTSHGKYTILRPSVAHM